MREPSGGMRRADDTRRAGLRRVRRTVTAASRSVARFGHSRAAGALAVLTGARPPRRASQVSITGRISARISDRAPERSSRLSRMLTPSIRAPARPRPRHSGADADDSAAAAATPAAGLSAAAACARARLSARADAARLERRSLCAERRRSAAAAACELSAPHASDERRTHSEGCPRAAASFAPIGPPVDFSVESLEAARRVYDLTHAAMVTRRPPALSPTRPPPAARRLAHSNRSAVVRPLVPWRQPSCLTRVARRDRTAKGCRRSRRARQARRIGRAGRRAARQRATPTWRKPRPPRLRAGMASGTRRREAHRRAFRRRR